MGLKGSDPESHRRAFRSLCDLLIDAVETGNDRLVSDYGAIDWVAVIALAHRHRVIATLANSRFTNDPSLPAGVRMMFTQIASGTREKAKAVAAQITDLAGLLNRAGSTPMLLKGASYSVSNLYPHPAMRYLSDIDILLPEGELDKCRRMLGEQGYAQVEKSPSAQWHHLPGIAHPQKPAIIEIHRWPIAFPYSKLLQAGEFLAAGIAHETSGGKVLVPSDFHSAILTIAHGELSDRNYLLGRTDLRRLVDMALLARRSPQTVSDEHLGEWFAQHGARTAFEYHQHWMSFLDRRRPAAATGTVSRILYKRAQYLDRHPRALSFTVRALRPWIALRRDLSDPVLRRDLARNVARPSWWRRQMAVFSETRPE